MAENFSNGKMCLGANMVTKARASFCVWAPYVSKVQVKIIGARSQRVIDLKKDKLGYFAAEVNGVQPGTRYFYRLDKKRDRPDPVSRSQPEGVHGPSEIIDPGAYKWKDRRWKGLKKTDLVIYEIHVGTFTPEGTLKAAIEKIPYLKQLGITCVELMPLAQFPGDRNWGYDGVDLFAVQKSYGGSRALKKFVDACHAAGLAVCLDVVYNHLGPEGNYLNEFGPYFTDRYQTPWGKALNYDDSGCDHVRRFVIQNALYWIREYHIDGLRLDAIHSIFDNGPRHILAELQESVQDLGRALKKKVFVIAESDLNDAKVVKEQGEGGYGLDGQWSDDFHHAVHRVLTGEKQGYYSDFSGLADIAKAVKETFVYDGKYSAFRSRAHGNSVKKMPGDRFVICIQNHDQIGNRGLGDRLSESISFDALKVGAGLLLLSPYLPLLFMGEEFGETAPFRYFIDHGDPGLIKAVREGRRHEFASFGWKKLPDPAAPGTFNVSKLKWARAEKGRHAKMLKLYRDLLQLRRKLGIPSRAGKAQLSIQFDEKKKWLFADYKISKRLRAAVFFSFTAGRAGMTLPRRRSFRELLNSADREYGGKLAAGRSKTVQEKVTFKGMGFVAGQII